MRFFVPRVWCQGPAAAVSVGIDEEALGPKFIEWVRLFGCTGVPCVLVPVRVVDGHHRYLLRRDEPVAERNVIILDAPYDQGCSS